MDIYIYKNISLYIYIYIYLFSYIFFHISIHIFIYSYIYIYLLIYQFIYLSSYSLIICFSIYYFPFIVNLGCAIVFGGATVFAYASVFSALGTQWRTAVYRGSAQPSAVYCCVTVLKDCCTNSILCYLYMSDAL